MAALAAVTTVALLAAVGPSIVDPAPRLAPAVRPDPSWPELVVLVVGMAVTTAVATVLAWRRSTRASAGEVLRGDG